MSTTGFHFGMREMLLDDIPSIMEIERACFTLPWPESTFHFELSKNTASHMLVAEGGLPGEGSILGYIGCWHFYEEAHISTIAVTPSSQNTGVGTELLRTMLARMAGLGAVVAMLEVREHNSGAQRLYEKFGFEKIGRRKGYYRDNNEDALLMNLDDIGSSPYLVGGSIR